MSDNKYKFNIANNEEEYTEDAEERKMMDVTPYSVLFGYVRRSPENEYKPAMGVSILDELSPVELAEAAYSSLLAAYEFLLSNNNVEECKAFIKSVKKTINEDKRFDIDSEYSKKRFAEKRKND